MKSTSDIPDVKCFNETGISAPVGNHCRKSKTVLKINGQQSSTYDLISTCPSGYFHLYTGQW